MKNTATNNILNFALLATLLASASSVVAEEAGFYGRVDAGYSSAKDADITNQPTTGSPQIAGSIQNVGSSGIFGFGAGYRFNNQFRTDVTYNYRGGYQLDDSDSSINFKSNITSNTLMANGYWSPDLSLGTVKPYVGLGLGWSRNKMDTLTLSTVGASAVGLSGKSNDFAWQLMAGADIALSESLMLDVAYHYVDLGSIESDAGDNHLVIGGLPTVSVADGIKGSLRAHELQVGLRFKF